ncbi:hypothetical protein [Peribacillus sp. RS7]|jgi:hypothetical protein|uniref:hypothetical protein n=1 Tax=Peribacillus sp. RS7 TaxID=3242679 RepID=UPI0035C0D5A5
MKVMEAFHKRLERKYTIKTVATKSAPTLIHKVPFFYMKYSIPTPTIASKRPIIIGCQRDE